MMLPALKSLVFHAWVMMGLLCHGSDGCSVSLRLWLSSDVTAKPLYQHRLGRENQ